MSTRFLDTARAATVALAAFLSMAAQVQVQLATDTLVLQYILVDGFMANRRFAFLFQSAADLLRTPLLFQQRINTAHQRRGQLDCFRLVRLALLCFAVRLRVSVVVLPPVAGQFTTPQRSGVCKS